MNVSEELWFLANAVCADSATKEQRQRLNELLSRDPDAALFYVVYLRMHGLLLWHCRDATGGPSEIPASASPAHNTLGSAFHGAFSYLSSGWPVAYLVATIIFAVGALIGSSINVSHPAQMARESAPPSPTLPSAVGRITGMADCPWETGSSANHRLPIVSIGDRFILSSGLLEITYNTGAQVILQGPVTYEIDSVASGFLSVGKLVARLKKKGEGGNGKVEIVTNGPWPIAGQSPNLQISKSPINHSALPLPPSSFAVRTPTAIVTDLGTEFGVDVDRSGTVETHVFDGEVCVQRVVRDKPTGEVHRLAAGDTARIESSEVVLHRAAPSATDFVRALPRSTSSPGSQPDVLAYWRFEEDVPPPGAGMNEADPQLNVIHDQSGRWHHLDYWPKGNAGMGNYVAGSDVPPTSMFRPGCSGGSKSFNSAALDPHECGLLFFSPSRHGNLLDFDGSFTLEGYFKTDGDQSEAGLMTVLFKGEGDPAYQVDLNNNTPGAMQFTIFDKSRKPISTTVVQRNYADGQWHYFAARYEIGKKGHGGVMSLLVGNEDGTSDRSSTATAPDFVLNWPNNILLIGRKVHWPREAVAGHFRGSIDEIRVSRGSLPDVQLLFAPQGGKEGSSTDNVDR